MKLSFTKMHGCGNDYIYMDCFRQQVLEPAQLSRTLSRPHFGIGGDGLILILPSGQADAKMRIFNRDGSEGKMCGNGIRCVAKYLYDSGIVSKRDMRIDTLSGVKEVQVHPQENGPFLVTVDMGPAILNPPDIPVLLPGNRVVERQVELSEGQETITCVSMGNPHCVVFRPQVAKLDLEQEGPRFETAPIFPQGVNTEFVQVIGENQLQMRVWERGSGETLACGTGACASAVAAVLTGRCNPREPVQVVLRGGTLSIRDTGTTILMTGQAQTVFTGEVEL